MFPLSGLKSISYQRNILRPDLWINEYVHLLFLQADLRSNTVSEGFSHPSHLLVALAIHRSVTWVPATVGRPLDNSMKKARVWLSQEKENKVWSKAQTWKCFLLPKCKQIQWFTSVPLLFMAKGEPAAGQPVISLPGVAVNTMLPDQGSSSIRGISYEQPVAYQCK